MPHRQVGLALALALALPALDLAAQPAASPEPGDLGEVAVTATRIPERAADAPASVWTVGADEMEARAALSVAEALRTASSLSLSDVGPEGAKKSPSLRGSTTNQVLVLVDGQRVNDAFSGLVDLSSIPAERIERIEVMRGGGSALYGGDAVGGVVNVITKAGASPLVLRVENGSYLPEARVLGFGVGKVREAGADPLDLVDSQRLSLSASPALGDAVLRLGGSLSRAANAYTYSDSSAARRGLENAGFLGGEASAGLELPLLAGTLAAGLSGSLARKGVPGPESAPTTEASEADTGAVLTARYAAETSFSDLASIDLATRLSWTRIDYSDGGDGSGDGLHDLASASLDFAQRYLASDAAAVAYGASASLARAASDAVGDRLRWTAAAFVEPAFGSGALSFRPSLRYDWYSDFSSRSPLGGLAGQLGAALRLSESDSLKLALSRAYRVPTLQDLHWPAGAGTEGNPGLVPETAYEAGLSFERRRPGLSGSASAYVRYSRDVILWQPGADSVWRPSNYGAALYPGLELELRAEPMPGWSVDANYAYLRSTALSGGLSLADDRRLPMTPLHSLNATLARSGARLSWSATARYVGKRYLKLANAAALPAYFTLDCVARLRISERYATYVALDNALGEEYEVVEGYPMPGARLRVGLELVVD